MKEIKKRKPMTEATKEKIRQAKLKAKEDIDFKEVKQGDLITGAGDLIAKVTKFLGFEPCDECIKRRDQINSWSVMAIIYTPTYDEIKMLKKVRDEKILREDSKSLFFALYNKTFGKRIKECNCPGVVLSMVQNFDKHFNLDIQ